LTAARTVAPVGNTTLAIRTNRAPSEISLKRFGTIPAEGRQQDGDLPNSLLHNRQLLPSVGKIILKHGYFLERGSWRHFLSRSP